jgi:hypothetical protein
MRQSTPSFAAFGAQFMWIRSRLLLLLLPLVCGGPPAMAMHKCVDADGNVTYSQTACEEPQGRPPPVAADKPGAAARSGDVLCDRVQAYALELAHGMLAGVGLDRALAVLGGRGGADYRGSHAGSGSRGAAAIVGDDALEIINHVFAFAGRGEQDPERIAESAADQCRRGRFDFERGAPGGADGLRRTAGSGILLNPQGVVLTADSVIAECGGLRSFRGGAWHDTRVLRRDAVVGLALLVADGLHGRPGVFAEGDGPMPATVQVVSLPLRGVLSGEPSLAEARVQRPAADVAGALISAVVPDPAARQPLSLPPAPALPGSPLIGDGGLIAGMLVPGQDGRLDALPTAAVRHFLAGADVSHFGAAALGPLTTQEIRRRAAGFTVHVECLP